MRNAKKFLTLALAVLMVMSVFVTGVNAGRFTDVDPENKELNEAIDLIESLGITKGTSETTFGTEELVTRQQMALFMYRLMHAGRSVEGGENTTKFTDLVDPTFNFAIAWANDAGVIKGTTPTTFNPTGSIILQDAYTMIVRALGYEDEETLPYPFGFIDEAEELDLDENLPSDVTYLTELTRGNLALILYKAFYADMAESTTQYRMINEVLTPVEVHPTVASKVFGVVESKWGVSATPNKSLDFTEKTDEGYIELYGYGEPVEFAKLGLSGTADDYFLAGITLYKKGNKIFAAQSKLDVATGKIEFVLDKNSDDYSSKKEDYENPITGEFKIGNIKGYLFDAPKKNGEQIINVNFLELKALDDAKKSKKTMTFDSIRKVDIPGGDTALKQYDEYLATARQGGFYEATAYDTDGDGYANYVWYKPYTFGKLYTSDTKANKEYTETLLKKHVDTKKDTYVKGKVKNSDKEEPLIYTQEAMIDGVSAKSGDFVLAYVNGPANYISVGAVVTGIEGTVKRTSAKNFTLTTGDVIKYDKNLEKLILGKPMLGEVSLGSKAVFYNAEGKLVYQTEIEDGNDDEPYYGDLALIIADEDNDGNAFDSEKIRVDGKSKTVKYAYAWIDGEINYVEIADYADDDEQVKQDAEYINGLIGTVSSYEVDADGKYMFTAVSFEYSDDLTTDDEDALYGKVKSYAPFESPAVTSIEKVVNNIYSFGDKALNPHEKAEKFSFAAKARMYIKSVDNDGDPVYTLYTDEDLPSFSEDVEFNVVKYIMVNNTTSNIEKLALLYAETDDTLDYKEDDKEYRIVADAYVEYDSDEKTYSTYYNLYNPQTGEIEENVIGKKSGSKSKPDVAAVYGIFEVSDEVLNDKATAKTILSDNGNLVKVEEFDEGNKLVKIGGQYYKYDEAVVTKLFIADPDSDDEDSFEKVDASALDLNEDENTRYDVYNEEYTGDLYVYILKDSEIKDNDFYMNLDTVIIVDMNVEGQPA